MPDPYKCTALQTEGRWLDAPEHANSHEFRNWQPPGCILHEYSVEDINKCLACKRLVFIGDSTIRQTFWAAARKLDKRGAEQARLTNEEHGDQTFERGCIRIDFRWDPYLNSSRLRDDLVSYQQGADASNITSRNATEAAVIFVGGGSWHARYLDYEYLTRFKESVDNIARFAGYEADPRSKDIAILPPLRRSNPNLLLLAPVQPPYYQKLSPARAETILPEKVLPMNDYLRQTALRYGLEILWSFVSMIWHQPVAYEDSGIHVVDSVAAKQVDIILNMRCNSEPKLAHYPFDKTCCNDWVRIKLIQEILIFLAAAAVFCAVFAAVVHKYSHWCQGTAAPHTAQYRSICAYGIFGGAILYCYVADRTTVFEKSQKLHSQESFLVLSVLALFAGLSSIGSSAKPAYGRPGPDHTPGTSFAERPFLSREQTDEWKGWMQVVVLAYHYSGMSQVLWVYMIVRLLVASYLFMTGYGHTIHLYKSGDYSLRRVTIVLVRTNLLSCALPYVMQTSYPFYYFPALTSFWFLVIYSTMKIYHSRNGQAMFVLGKIVMSAMFVTFVTKTPGILEAIFSFLSTLCKIDWDVNELRFRVCLDLYVVFVGMVVAILYVQLTVLPTSERSRPIMYVVSHHLVMWQIISVLIAVTTFLCFGFIIARVKNKYQYNDLHPYVSCIPVLAFVTLRNAHGRLRSFHSYMFAWLGQCSLETFVLQYHIWLAGDTKGILRLGLFGYRGQSWGRPMDLFFTSIIFLWVSRSVAEATSLITSIFAGRPYCRECEDLRKGNGKTCHDASAYEVTPLPAFHMRKKSEEVEEINDTGGGSAWIGQVRRSFRGEGAALKIRLGIFLLSAWALNWVY